MKILGILSLDAIIIYLLIRLTGETDVFNILFAFFILAVISIIAYLLEMK